MSVSFLTWSLSLGCQSDESLNALLSSFLNSGVSLESLDFILPSSFSPLLAPPWSSWQGESCPSLGELGKEEALSLASGTSSLGSELPDSSFQAFRPMASLPTALGWLWAPWSPPPPPEAASAPGSPGLAAAAPAALVLGTPERVLLTCRSELRWRPASSRWSKSSSIMNSRSPSILPKSLHVTSTPMVSFSSWEMPYSERQTHSFRGWSRLAMRSARAQDSSPR
mmetsp:Transcript_31691/g.90966  ORF Transcript_31691/g.90966 Transcript_31691/m.90966 type:complete len:225 (+) Transcript_31691:744-1418(+)